MYFLLVLISCMANTFSGLGKGPEEAKVFCDELAKEKIMGEISEHFAAFVKSENEDKRRGAHLFLQQQFNTDDIWSSPFFWDKEQESEDNYLTLIAKMKGPIRYSRVALMEMCISLWREGEEKACGFLKEMSPKRRLPSLPKDASTLAVHSPVETTSPTDDEITPFIDKRIEAFHRLDANNKDRRSTLTILLAEGEMLLAEKFLALEIDFVKNLREMKLLNRYEACFAVGSKSYIAKAVLKRDLELEFKIDTAGSADDVRSTRLKVSPAFVAVTMGDSRLVEKMIELNDDLLIEPVADGNNNTLMLAISERQEGIFKLICRRSHMKALSPLGRINDAQKDGLIIAIDAGADDFVEEIVARYFHQVSSEDHLGYAVWAKKQRREVAARIILAAGLEVPSSLKSYSKLAGMSIGGLILASLGKAGAAAAAGVDVAFMMPGIASSVYKAALSAFSKLGEEFNVKGYFRDEKERAQVCLLLREMHLEYEWIDKVALLLRRNPKVVKIEFLRKTFIDMYKSKFEGLLKDIKQKNQRALDGRLKKFISKSACDPSKDHTGTPDGQWPVCVCTFNKVKLIYSSIGEYMDNEECSNIEIDEQIKDPNKCYNMVKGLQNICERVRGILAGGYEA